MAVSFRSYLHKSTNHIDVLSSNRIPLGSMKKDINGLWTADEALRVSILNYNGEMQGIGDYQIDRRLQGSLYPRWFPQWHHLEPAIRQLSHVLY